MGLDQFKRNMNKVVHGIHEMKVQVDSLFHRVQTVATHCAHNGDVNNVKAYLKKSEDYVGYALRTSGFTRNNGKVQANLRKSYEKLKGLNGELEKVHDYCLDLEAVAQIARAASILNEWTAPNTKRSNAEAAAAFDQLFGGVARFAKKLPKPLDAYAMIFEEICKNNFFTKMQRLSDYEDRPVTPKGQVLKQLLQEIDEPFRPR